MSLIIIGPLGGLTTASRRASCRCCLCVHSDEGRMVLGGEGEARVRVDGGAEQRIPVSGTPRSDEVATAIDGRDAVLDVGVSPGVEVYSFAFG